MFKCWGAKEFVPNKMNSPIYQKLVASNWKLWERNCWDIDLEPIKILGELRNSDKDENSAFIMLKVAVKYKS